MQNTCTSCGGYFDIRTTHYANNSRRLQFPLSYLLCVLSPRKNFEESVILFLFSSWAVQVGPTVWDLVYPLKGLEVRTVSYVNARITIFAHIFSNSYARLAATVSSLSIIDAKI